MTAENLCNRPTPPAPVCYSGRVMGKRRRSTIHKDTIDSLLDRLSDMREELLAIERSLERIQAQSSNRAKMALPGLPATVVKIR
jgi:hypothetical protein